MGPLKAAEIFASRHPEAKSFEVTLYGSLAATGKGHLTDVAITGELEKTAPCCIRWRPDIELPFHPNGMSFTAVEQDGSASEPWVVYSIGGGALSEGKENDFFAATPDVYPLHTIGDKALWKTKMHTIQLMELQEIELIAQDNRTTPAILCCITRSCPCGWWLISF